MARKTTGTILQEELYPSGIDLPQEDLSTGRSTADHPWHNRSAEERPRETHSRERNRASVPARDELDDARLVDLDSDEQTPFLRAQKRVSARRSSLPKRTASWLLWGSAVAAVLGIIAFVAAGIYEYGERSWRFRIDSSDNIDVSGMQNVTKAQIMEVMGADIGRNIFFVPLAQQKAQLEQIPWVESASVMRFVPNRLKVEIRERVPVAFGRVGPRICLIDAGGTLMEMSHQHKYSFPVILGMNPGEPLSTRAPRMQVYNELVRQLDSAGARYSQDLSEVDLSDLDNVKVRVNDPAGAVLVELGSSQAGASDFLKRYQTYQSHVQEWRQQFQRLESVNLRYDNQAIVNPDMEKPDAAKRDSARAEVHKTDLSSKSKPSALKAIVATQSAASAVKPAALIAPIVTPITPHDRTSLGPAPKPAFELTQKKLDATAGTVEVRTKNPSTAAIKSKSPAHAKSRSHSAAAKRSAARKAASQHAPTQKAPSKKALTPALSNATGKPSAATPKMKAEDIAD